MKDTSTGKMSNAVAGYHTRRQRMEENGCSLKHVPEKNRTEKLCIATVEGGIYDNAL
jgi:hypothetical protein